MTRIFPLLLLLIPTALIAESEVSVLEYRALTKKPPTQACAILDLESSIKICTTTITKIPKAYTSSQLSLNKQDSQVASISYFTLNSKVVSEISSRKTLPLYTVFLVDDNQTFISTEVKRIENKQLHILSREALQILEESVTENEIALGKVESSLTEINQKINNLSSSLYNSQKLKLALHKLQFVSNQLLHYHFQSELLDSLFHYFEEGKKIISNEQISAKASLTSDLRKVLEKRSRQQIKGIPKIQR